MSTETSLVKVRVFFDFAEGYTEVHSFYVEAPTDGDVDEFGVVDGSHCGRFAESAAEEAFTKLNVDHPMDWAHRSMSVGDVVVVAETALLCAGSGWERIDSDQLLAPREVAAAVTRLADHLKTGGGDVPEEMLDDLDAAGISLIEAMDMILQGVA